MNTTLHPVTCFLTFADSRMIKALERIKAQAEAMNFFDQIRVCTEMHLDEEFRAKWNHILKPDVRGYGYWIWKPYTILKTLESLPEGSLLLYCDAGCHLNPEAKQRLQYYFDELNSSHLKIKAFPALSSNIDADEKRWTKGDIFEYFGCRSNKNITHTPQLAAGHIFCIKNNENIQFFKKWLSVWDEKISLLDDSKSKARNLAGFIENRHDQSIFSVLYKLHEGTPLPEGETKYFNAPDKIAYPIWDARDYGADCRDKRFIARLSRFIRSRRITTKIKLEIFKQRHPAIAALFTRED